MQGGLAWDGEIEIKKNRKFVVLGPLSLKVLTSVFLGLNLRRRARQSSVLFLTAR